MMTTTRRDSILSECGFKVTIPGDLDGDGQVDMADLTKLKEGLGVDYDLDDFAKLKENFGRVEHPVTLVHASNQCMPDHPDARLPHVYTTCANLPDGEYRTPETIGGYAKAYKEKYGPHIFYIDNESAAGLTTPQAWRDRCQLFADMCDAVRAEGMSPGVCSVAPWCVGVSQSRNTDVLTEAVGNEIAGEVLIPHVDWLGCEMYGYPAARLSLWLDKFWSLGWDCCISPFLYPYSFGSNPYWASVSEYVQMLKLAHWKADITVLWSDSLDENWGTSLRGRWLYDVLALYEWDLLTMPEWLTVRTA